MAGSPRRFRCRGRTNCRHDGRGLHRQPESPARSSMAPASSSARARSRRATISGLRSGTGRGSGGRAATSTLTPSHSCSVAPSRSSAYSDLPGPPISKSTSTPGTWTRNLPSETPTRRTPPCLGAGMDRSVAPLLVRTSPRALRLAGWADTARRSRRRPTPATSTYSTWASASAARSRVRPDVTDPTVVEPGSADDGAAQLRGETSRPVVVGHRKPRPLRQAAFGHSRGGDRDLV